MKMIIIIKWYTNIQQNKKGAFQKDNTIIILFLIFILSFILAETCGEPLSLLFCWQWPVYKHSLQVCEDGQCMLRSQLHIISNPKFKMQKWLLSRTETLWNTEL